MSLPTKTKQLIVIGIYLPSRTKQAPAVQKILTKYGCSIKTRIGLHESSGEFCAPYGLIILEMSGSAETINEMIADLKSLDQAIIIKKMLFKT